MYPQSTAITAFDLLEKRVQARSRGYGYDIEQTIASVARFDKILSGVAR